MDWSRWRGKIRRRSSPSSMPVGPSHLACCARPLSADEGNAAESAPVGVMTPANHRDIFYAPTLCCYVKASMYTTD